MSHVEFKRLHRLYQNIYKSTMFLFVIKFTKIHTICFINKILSINFIYYNDVRKQFNCIDEMQVSNKKQNNTKLLK
jgi:hypothetical protein